MSTDELALDKIGDERTAFFVILEDTDDSFSFIAALMYSQLFNVLTNRADLKYKGRLPYHVRFLLDEFPNIGKIPRFEKLIATIRSREMSACVILQTQSQSAISDVGMTPQAWNGAVFSLIQNLSQTVILPIAGVILTFVVTYELITIVMEKNNMADFDTFNIYKWIIKTFIAIFILTNTWSIVIGIFDLAQQVVSNSSGLMLDSEIMNTSLLAEFEAQIADMEFFQLLGLWFQVQIAGLLMNILAIAIMAVVWGRMIEIYLITSIAPIPLATITNREYGQMGNNYLKNLFAVAFQGFLIMVCIGIHMAMSSTLLVGATDASVSLWQMVGTTVILVFMLFKTGSIAKSIFGAH